MRISNKKLEEMSHEERDIELKNRRDESTTYLLHIVIGLLIFIAFCLAVFNPDILGELGPEYRILEVTLTPFIVIINGMVKLLTFLVELIP